MQKLCIVIDTPTKEAAIRHQLDGIFDSYCLDFNRIRDTEPPQHLLFDIEFTDGRAVTVKEWLKRKPRDGKIIFVVDKASHLQVIQATALGATGILRRPFEREALIKLFLSDFELLSRDDPNDPIRTSPGVGETFVALQNVFEIGVSRRAARHGGNQFGRRGVNSSNGSARPRSMARHRAETPQPDVSALLDRNRHRSGLRPAPRAVPVRPTAAVVRCHAARYRQGPYPDCDPRKALVPHQR